MKRGLPEGYRRRSTGPNLPLWPEDTPRQRRGTALSSFKPRLESPAEALAGEARAVRQEEALLAWFRLQPGRRFTPSEVHALAGLRCPITSVRRALTNLSTPSEDSPTPPLEHHREDRRPGPHGARESTWSLRDPERNGVDGH